MRNELKLRVVFDMVDRMTRPLRQTLTGSKGLSRALADTKKRLSELSKQQKTVNAVKSLRTEMGQTATKLKAAKDRMATLQTQIQATTNPTVRMQNAMRRASASVVMLTQAQEKQRTRLGELNTRMQQAGRGALTLAAYEKTLQSSIAKTNATIAEQGRRLQSVQGRRAVLAPARERLQGARSAAAEMAVGGYATRAVGGRVIGGVDELLGEAKHAKLGEVQIQALGAGDEKTRELIKFAREHKAYGISTKERIGLMGDAMSVMNDVHHAETALPTLTKMKFTNEVMYGAEQGGERDQQFMNMMKAIEQRGGANDAETFAREANNVQKVIAATRGRVGGDEWQEFIKTGGVAAKQMRSDAFYFQMEPLIQEQGGAATGAALMSAYQNLIEGRTTVRATRKLMSLGLLDKKKVEYDKVGRVKAFADGALLNSDQFKSSQYEWMKNTLLPKLREHGITSERDTLSAIGSIFTNRRASGQWATMYLQQAAIEKSERLNHSAYNIEEGFAVAKTLPQGKEIDARAKKADLEERLGSNIIPLYNRGLEMTANLIERVSAWMERNEGTARVLTIGLAALGALLVTGGTLTIGLAAIIGPLALTRYGMEMLGIKSTGTLSGLKKVGRFLGGGLVNAIKIVGKAFMALGRLVMAHPILAIIAILAAAAIYVWQNWETLGPKFKALWDSIKGFFVEFWVDAKAAFSGGIGAIGAFILNWSPLGLFYRAFAAVMSWFGVEMPAKFTQFGADIIAGLVSGISDAFPSVKGVISLLGDSAVGWFKEKLGIHSPSRVFDMLGGFIGQGAAQGIEGERANVAAAVGRLAGTASMVFGALTGSAIASPVSMRPLIDTRPPLSAAAPAESAAAAGGGSSTFEIHIHVGQGADPNEIAVAVRREIERIEREKSRRMASRLTD
ncbi:hypothetical protein [Burkholderia ambifaria]|uniref:hypothetical protein n=1 Tax=Burkholderia ambifaria TaxID=152480 RepID=UPI00158C6A73|nr:hypothetical protein [Burkholderia ambifaria]